MAKQWINKHTANKECCFVNAGEERIRPALEVSQLELFQGESLINSSGGGEEAFCNILSLGNIFWSTVMLLKQLMQYKCMLAPSESNLWTGPLPFPDGICT